MARIIVTDLTRFNNRGILCTAGIDTETGECVRPMPYLHADKCKELNILPGAILTGELTMPQGISAPHIESVNYQRLNFSGHCSIEEFYEVLSNSEVEGVQNGFEVELDQGEKCIPDAAHPARSLITIRVEPKEVQLVEDEYKANKMRIHFTDSKGRRFNYISITDLGFSTYAEHYSQNDCNYDAVNGLIHDQEEIFLRVGLSQFFKAPDGREGYWLQINGIYSFPNYFEVARRYE